MNPAFGFLDDRPIVIALAGSNGAGKSTFFDSFLADAGLRFVNADALAASVGLPAYAAAEMAAAIRAALVEHRESFVFETVLWDPVGDKIHSLESYVQLGYTVVLIFIRIDSPRESIKRVAMRVSQGGHDVPDDKLLARFERTLANLELAIRRLPHVLVYDNQDLSKPFQLAELYENGRRIERSP